MRKYMLQLSALSLLILSAISLCFIPLSSASTTTDVTGTGGSGNAQSGNLNFCPLTASASGTLQTLNVNVNAVSGTKQITLALYTTYSGGKCSGLIATGTAVMDVGWNYISVTSTSITQGVTYYIAVAIADAGTKIYYLSGSGQRYYRSGFTFSDPTGSLSDGGGNCFIMGITYQTTAPGYGQSVNGVPSNGISGVNGIPTGEITNVNGVT
jgi:hypothetical protein